MPPTEPPSEIPTSPGHPSIPRVEYSTTRVHNNKFARKRAEQSLFTEKFPKISTINPGKILSQICKFMQLDLNDLDSVNVICSCCS